MHHYVAGYFTERRKRVFYDTLTDVMKSSLLIVLLVATCAGALGAQVTPGAAPPPAAEGGTISGEIVAEGTGTPIPFSTVRLQPLGRERFTDRNGTFTWYDIPPGEYRMQVKMLGYLPFDTAITVKSRTTAAVTVTMTRIPTSLDEVQVSAPPRKCLYPDEMGYVEDPELATVLNEAKKNAQREQLLRRTYPFEYQLAQSHDTYDPVTRTSAMQYDTVTYRSDDSWRYRKGKVVSDDRNRIFGDVRLMRLPTLGDLADRIFLAAHCFKYSGVVDDNGIPSHRIDFLPDSTLRSPDVEGSIYLDSATYLIRRAQFRLTRGGTVKPPILGMEVTTTYKEILPNVALFDEIKSVQPLSGATPGGRPKEFREVQHLLSYRFLLNGPPGTSPGHKWIPAGDAAALYAKTSQGQSAESRRPLPKTGPPPP
jgi:hypothetical protein